MAYEIQLLARIRGMYIYIWFGIDIILWNFKIIIDFRVKVT